MLSSACVVTQEEFRTLRHDVRSMRVELNTLKKEGIGEGHGGGMLGTDLVARLEELSVETRITQGMLEENTHRLSELGQRLDQTEMKVARLTGDPVPTIPPPRVPGAAPFTPSAPPSSPTGQPLPPSGQTAFPQPPAAASPERQVMQGPMPSPEQVYQDGWIDYAKGNYDLAIQSFQTYLTFFPKTSLVPNAQYWLAESYYGKGEFLKAIQEFDKLIKEHPDSSKVPSAMLKQGYAYLELGEPTQGQGILRELVAKFPRSREARLAQDRL